MEKFKKILLPTGLLLAATVGAGIFALPGIFNAAGWLLSLIYLAVVSLAIIASHILFWRTLSSDEHRHGLLGIIKEGLGKRMGQLAFFAIVGGLTLTLVAYLILGAKFLNLIFPLGDYSLMVFWVLAAIPILFSLKRLVKLESSVVLFTIGTILFIFFSAPSKGAIFAGPAINWGQSFLPFGVFLFSLAGWTSIAPIVAVNKREKFFGKPIFLWLGTAIAAILYLLFVVGIFGSAPQITADTISGLAGWSVWKLYILAALGIFAIPSVYWAISHEIKNSLEHDSGWTPVAAASFAMFAPLFLVWAGLTNFTSVVGLAGGVFLAAQYIFIVLVSRDQLRLKRAGKLLANILIIIFAASIVYEIYYFIGK